MKYHVKKYIFISVFLFLSGLLKAQKDSHKIIGKYKIQKIYYDSVLYFDADNDSFVYQYPGKMYRILFGPMALKDPEYLAKQISVTTKIMKERVGAEVLNILSDTMLALPLLDSLNNIHEDTLRFFSDDSTGSIYFLEKTNSTKYTELWVNENIIYTSKDMYNCVIWRRESEPKK